MSDPLLASRILRGLVSVPSEMRTRQWDATSVWIRERAFFMAAVDRAETLDLFRSSAERIAAGDLSPAEAREEIRKSLKAQGYEPKPGQEGTIKDLRTARRINVALDTNVAQARGYGRWQRQQAAIAGFPAQRLVRLRTSAVPRADWPQRFAGAVGATYFSGANIAEMAALVNHPCWIRLSRFGTPYAPFDFNSGMGLEPIDSDEAADLGLLPPEDAPDSEHTEMMIPQDRGLNATLEAKPAIRSQRVRSALAESLQGLAEWDGDRLVFTDPNGTRPYTAEQLADVITTPQPTGIPNLQAKAVKDWAEASYEVRARPDTDRWDDLIRAIDRTEPIGAGVPLHRGEGYPTAAAAMERIESIRTDARLTDSITSFSELADIASMHATINGPVQVVYQLITPDGTQAKSIAPSVKKLTTSYEAENELLFTGRSRFQVLDVSESADNSGRRFTVTLQEVVQ